MKNRLLPTFILIAYSAILIKVMVFKDVPTIKIGQLMLNFGGTQADRPANFLPFKTILPYLLGENGLMIAGINLIGNIALLVPIGFLVPFVSRSITWKKSLALAVAVGLAIEVMQVVLHVGIFDIDDVILNGLGVMIGYWTFMILAKWMRARKHKTIIISALIVIAIAAASLYAIYPHGQPVNPRVDAGSIQSDRISNEEGKVPSIGDLCGGTGGNGQIISVGNNTFTIKHKDGRNQIIKLTAQATIKTSKGAASLSDLKTGNRVTLVGGPNPDGSFTADAVFVCNGAGKATQSRE